MTNLPSYTQYMKYPSFQSTVMLPVNGPATNDTFIGAMSESQSSSWPSFPWVPPLTQGATVWPFATPNNYMYYDNSENLQSWNPVDNPVLSDTSDAYQVYLAPLPNIVSWPHFQPSNMVLYPISAHTSDNQAQNNYGESYQQLWYPGNNYQTNECLEVSSEYNSPEQPGVVHYNYGQMTGDTEPEFHERRSSPIESQNYKERNYESASKSQDFQDYQKILAKTIKDVCRDIEGLMVPILPKHEIRNLINNLNYHQLSHTSYKFLNCVPSNLADSLRLSLKSLESVLAMLASVVDLHLMLQTKQNQFSNQETTHQSCISTVFSLLSFLETVVGFLRNLSNSVSQNKATADQEKSHIKLLKRNTPIPKVSDRKCTSNPNMAN